MKKSAFQFSNPCLKKLDFFENPGYDSAKESVEIDISIDINVDRFEDKNEAIVELSVDIGSKQDDFPFYISITEGALFKWDENEIHDDENINKFLNQNAPSLLLSYIRPIVATVTSATQFNTYNLPFINFSGQKSKKE